MDGPISAKDMDLYLDVPVKYSLTGSPMFQIDENTGDVSTTPDFNPDRLSQNGLEIVLKVCLCQFWVESIFNFPNFRQRKSILKVNPELHF